MGGLCLSGVTAAVRVAVWTNFEGAASAHGGLDQGLLPYRCQCEDNHSDEPVSLSLSPGLVMADTAASNFQNSLSPQPPRING